MSLILKNWFVSWEESDGYTAPELRRKSIIGQLYGDPTIADGTEMKVILSSDKANIEGRIVTLNSGQTMELGEPEPGYLKWLIETGVGYNEIKHNHLEGKRPPGGGRGQGHH